MLASLYSSLRMVVSHVSCLLWNMNITDDLGAWVSGEPQYGL